MELFKAIIDILWPFAVAYTAFDIGRNWDEVKATHVSLYRRLTGRNNKGAN